MTDERATTWRCPKDGTAMTPMGRRARGGAWRCPTCRGIFLDTEAMRRMRGERQAWMPVLMSVLWSLLAVAVVRRLRRRPSPKSPA
jgi:Transcription factor zinc-finger